MDASTTETAPPEGVRTFRGRSLEEILPQVRAELGADAIVVRRREGLSGGVAGFFQRPFAEVEARVPHPDELDLGEGALRNDRATAEGLPAIQALVAQARPFADALAVAQGGVAEHAHEVLVAAAASADAPAGLYGPQPSVSILAGDDDEVLEAEPYEPVALSAPAPAFAPEPAGPRRPAAAGTAVARLIAGGLSVDLAEDVVAEAVAHGLPFATPRTLKKLIRTTFARRLPVMADLGAGPRVLALVGAGGAGKSAAVAALASAYAAAGADVVVVALRAADGGRALAARLEPLGVSVLAAASAAEASRRLEGRSAALVLVDTPAAGPGDRPAVAALARELRELGVLEVHLTAPATLSAGAGDELVAALAPLGITHVALTHADQTARPGAAVELAITARKPLSYACTRDAVAPADPLELAGRLLP
jgi:flagellar biosynthesis GTPase FlhF